MRRNTPFYLIAILNPILLPFHLNCSQNADPNEPKPSMSPYPLPYIMGKIWERILIFCSCQWAFCAHCLVIGIALSVGSSPSPSPKNKKTNLNTSSRHFPSTNNSPPPFQTYIENFRLKSGFSLESRNLKKRLDSMVKGGLCVKNLYLNVSDGFEVPSRVFGSRLETLKLVGYEGCLKLPKTMGMGCLDGVRKISLMYVKFPQGNGGKELRICECEFSHLEMFGISAPKLEKLELIGEEYPFCAVNINCPGLVSIECRGYLNKAWTIENSTALVSADISFSKRGKVKEEVFSRYLSKALGGIHGVSSLTIPPSILQVITTSPQIREILPNVFHQLRKIVVDEWFNNMDVPSISSVAALLHRLPCLEAFTWKRMHYVSKKEKKVLDEEVQEKYSFSTALRTVEVKNFHGVEDEVKFVSFLLKSVASLEKVIITPVAGKKMVDVNEKLLTLPRSSSCVLHINLSKNNYDDDDEVDDNDEDPSQADEEANEESESDKEANEESEDDEE